MPWGDKPPLLESPRRVGEKEHAAIRETKCLDGGEIDKHWFCSRRSRKEGGGMMSFGVESHKIQDRGMCFSARLANHDGATSAGKAFTWQCPWTYNVSQQTIHFSHHHIVHYARFDLIFTDQAVFHY